MHPEGGSWTSVRTHTPIKFSKVRTAPLAPIPLERSKGMGAKGAVRTFENLMGVWVRTEVQLPPSGCMRAGSTLRPSPDTRRHGTRQGCKAGRSRARLRNPASQVTRGRYTNVLLNRRQNRPAKAG